MDDLKPAWVLRSDALAESVVALETAHGPEGASKLGLTQADSATLDLSAGWRERVAAAAAHARAVLDAAAPHETDERVREDIVSCAARSMRSSTASRSKTPIWSR